MQQTEVSIFEQHLGQTPADSTLLSPLTFIERTASVYPERTAVIHGSIRRNWADTYGRCRGLASAPQDRGIGTLHPGQDNVTEQNIIQFCRDNLATFKAPNTAVFCDLPKTSTGKIQKFRLRRDQAKEL